MSDIFKFSVLLLILLSIVSIAGATTTEIHKGDTVFVGEDGLHLNDDVFYGNDTKIAYFGSGKTTGAPAYVDTPSKSSFSVMASTFKDRQGAWYSYPEGAEAGHVAFYVDYPSIDMRLYAYRGGDSFDITNGKIVSGETLDFRIDSNLAPIFSRTGVTSSDEGVDIVFTNNYGATLTSLYNCAGVPVSIVNLHPTTSSFFAPSGSLTCLWDTGNSAYKTGDYTIYAKVNVNNIYNNLGSIKGVTVSPTLSTKTKTEEVSMGIDTPAPTPTSSVSISGSPSSIKTTAPTVKPTAKPTTATPTPTPTQTAEPTAAVTETPAPTQAPTQTPSSPLGTVTVMSALILGILAFAAIRKD